jgi:hypothetical protein
MKEKTMGTDKKGLIAVVKKVIYKTGLKGNLNPILEFHPTKELMAWDMDSIVFSSIESLVALKIGTKSRVRLKIEKGQPPVIDLVLREGVLPELPTHCESCNNQLVFETETRAISCKNVVCPATMRGFVYRIINFATNGQVPINTVVKFLNEYVISEDKNSIDNLSDFRFLLGQKLSSYNTQGRINAWKRVHGSEGEALWELEKQVIEYLSKPEQDLKQFWICCNFPRITKTDLEAISLIDPRNLAWGLLKREYKHLSDKTLSYLSQNIDLIKVMLDMYDHFAQKRVLFNAQNGRLNELEPEGAILA